MKSEEKLLRWEHNESENVVYVLGHSGNIFAGIRPRIEKNVDYDPNRITHLSLTQHKSYSILCTLNRYIAIHAQQSVYPSEVTCQKCLRLMEGVYEYVYGNLGMLPPEVSYDDEGRESREEIREGKGNEQTG